MGNLNLDLANGQNWIDIYSESFDAALSADGVFYTPIPEIAIPIQFSSIVIAALITCSNAKPTWHFAGFFNQKITVGFVNGIIPNSDAVQKRKLYLNRLTLLILPKLAISYSVSIEVPKWFQQVGIYLWEYTGIQIDSTEELIASTTNESLTQIQSKLDTLINR